MNFNYLYIDEKSLSYNELLTKFLIISDIHDSDDNSRDRSSTVVDKKIPSSHSKLDYEKDKEKYLKVFLFLF